MFCMKKLAAIGILAGVAILPAACASDQSASSGARPAASPPMSSAPMASPMSPSMGSPSMASPAGNTSSGSASMNMQGMMAQCADMRRQMRPGAAMTPDMRQMIIQCDQMDAMHGGAARPMTR